MVFNNIVPKTTLGNKINNILIKNLDSTIDTSKNKNITTIDNIKNKNDTLHNNIIDSFDNDLEIIKNSPLLIQNFDKFTLFINDMLNNTN